MSEAKTMTSVNCAKCGAEGWTEASAINEKVKKKLKCGICGYVNTYIHKPYKGAVMK